MTRVLIVDDVPDQLAETAEAARRAGFTPVLAQSGDIALALLRSDPTITAVLLDLVMPDCDGMAVLATMAKERLDAPVVMAATSLDLQMIATLSRAGAADVIEKPVTPERLLLVLTNALQRHAQSTALAAERHRRAGALSVADVVRGPAIDRGLSLASRAGKSPAPMLVEGETGAGKHLLARLIHGGSDRTTKPFIVRHCRLVSTAALESTLVADLLAARGGTLVLGEIAVLPSAAQQTLLHFIETGEVKTGATRPERPNVRLIATSRVRLLNLAMAGILREDLYYRLNVLPTYLPPLRERRDEIAPLVTFFLRRFAVEVGKPIAGIDERALELLRLHAWAGNIRELENTVYRAVILADGQTLTTVDFPQLVAARDGLAALAALTESLPLPSAPVHVDQDMHHLKQTEGPGKTDRFLTGDGEITPLARLERDLIEFALSHHGGRMSKVARTLGIGRSTLYRKLREFGFDQALLTEAAE
jgi:DNA-binding NtrC family response regulator